MEQSAMETISERLASIDDLYFPTALQSTALNPIQRKTALLGLLSRDAPIFLERYGSSLTVDELQAFDTLKTDYEVGWHLNRLRRSRNPTAAEARARSVTVKNRRRAYMERLVGGGQYFSEDAMREREPYLHHEYVGRFQDPVGRILSRPGELWSETLLRRCEEAVLVEKIRAEQERLGVDRSEWVGNPAEVRRPEEEMEEEEEEEEEEEDEEEEDIEEKGKDESSAPKAHADEESDGNAQGTASGSHEQTIPAEEMQYQLDQFTQIMKQKFLAGEDAEHLDYSKIDDDERLDDYWHREANLDAEEKYFDED